MSNFFELLESTMYRHMLFIFLLRPSNWLIYRRLRSFEAERGRMISSPAYHTIMTLEDWNATFKRLDNTVKTITSFICDPTQHDKLIEYRAALMRNDTRRVEQLEVTA